MRNVKVGDIVLLREKMSRNKWPMGRVIAIQVGNDGFVRNLNIVVFTNASKTFEKRILKQPGRKLVLKARMKIILNNKIELKTKYLEGRSVLIEKYMN